MKTNWNVIEMYFSDRNEANSAWLHIKRSFNDVEIATRVEERTVVTGTLCKSFVIVVYSKLSETCYNLMFTGMADGCHIYAI